MMSARSVFHSKVWHFNFSGNRTSVLPNLAISPLTVVLLQATLVSSGEDMAPKATPSIYNSAHAHTNIYRQKIDSAAIVDFFHLKIAEA